MPAIGTSESQPFRWHGLRLLAAVAASAILIGPALCTAAAAGGGPATAHAQRPYSVEDAFRLEGLGRYYGGPYAFSTDGRRLAITRLRPAIQQPNFNWDRLIGNSQGDIWVQFDASEPLVNITKGVSDGSGWFAPAWSPDGQRLSMVSTRGGNVCVWVWDAQTRTLRQVSERGVDLTNPYAHPVVWVDGAHLLFNALPPGKTPVAASAETQAQAIQWAKAQAGTEATANVLDSGVPVDLSQRPQADLLLMDVTTLQARLVAKGAGQIWSISPARSGASSSRTVVLTKQTSIYLPQANQTIPMLTNNKAVLAMATTDGMPILVQAAGVDDILDESIRWSPDGGHLAFLSFDLGRAQPPLLHILNASTGAAATRSLDGIDAGPLRGTTGLEWTASGELIVLGVKIVPGARTNSGSRRDWWVTQPDGAPTSVTDGFKSPPPVLFSGAGHSVFVGLADGGVWRIEPATGKRENLTSSLATPVKAMIWPAAPHVNGPSLNEPELGATYAKVVVSTGEGSSKQPYLVDLAGGRPTPIMLKDRRAEVVGSDPASGSLILRASDVNGLDVWRGTATNPQAHRLIEANQFLRDIKGAGFQLITYKSLKGETLNGWLMLPPDYQPGRRYPMITWVYAGKVFTPTEHGQEVDSPDAAALSLQVAAAKGFVVLLPSMPMSPDGSVDDPMVRLPEGVMPAVDRAIELGVADPDRLYLMGHSFGGFSTYGLVTQTHRFKAAVALAGPADLTSLYGVFDAQERYHDHPQEYLFAPWLFEKGQVDMGGPPWTDPQRYYRNSPINFVDRVTTPLMIIQGDLDDVPIQQGEEFFTSLYRQGKRAQFVRYWGEGHNFNSPANIRDMWDRIFAWLDEFGAQAKPMNAPVSSSPTAALK